MKTYGKKILTALLTIAMIISVVPNMAYAAEITYDTEADNNDIPSNATILSSTEAVTGVLTSVDDVDYYKYTVDVTGYYSFTFTNTANLEGSWEVIVYDSSLDELERWSFDGFTATSNTYNFKKGTELYLKIQEHYRDYSDGKEYSIAVNTTSDPNWEQEYNDTKSYATDITSNKSLHGNIYSKGDVDYYKYTVDMAGYHDFTIANPANLEGDWKVIVYDSSLNELESWKFFGYTATSNTYNFKKGTVLYIKIQGYYNSGDTVGKEYTLTANAKKSANWEQEKNNSYSKAITLKTNKTKYGNLYYGDDIDYYTYTASKTAAHKLTFEFDADDVGRGWNITIYDSSKNEILTVSEITTDKTISFKAKKGKKYYVTVRANNSYEYPTRVTYALKIK